MFHWVCLDKYARSLPNDTAPAGYTCQICNECIFPLDNLVSPVADALRGLLSDVNWARAGLGLPLLEERREKRPEFSIPSGPRPPPEGESVTSNSALKDGSMFSRYALRSDVDYDYKQTAEFFFQKVCNLTRFLFHFLFPAAPAL